MPSGENSRQHKQEALTMKTKGNWSSLIGALFILLASMSLSGCMQPLQSAAISGDNDAVKRLLNEGADVNAKYDYDYTALMYAASSALNDTVKLLIENGADVNAKNRGGATALTIAARSGNAETAKLLAEKGADIDTALAGLKRRPGDISMTGAFYRRRGVGILETIRAERKAAAQPQPPQGVASQPSPAPVVDTGVEPLTKKLRELKKLQDDGVLTKEEYESQKRKLLEKGF